MNNLIEVVNLKFGYGKSQIFDCLNFHVSCNEFVLLAGNNGQGKTTLLKLILGMINNYQGSITRNLESIHQIGYLPQTLNIDVQFPITVLSVVLMGTLGHSILGRYKKSDYEAARFALKIVKLDGYENTPFRVLSGGLRQRVLIARSLTCHPQLLILDEPFSYLDATASKSLIELLENLRKDMSILIVSHSYKIIAPLITRVFNLSANDAWKDY